jgi:hypothetical protein
VLGRELEQAMQPIALAAVNQRDETMAPRRGILFGVVCGCPLGTGHDRCEWHSSGTAGEDDFADPGAVGSTLPEGWARLGEPAWLLSGEGGAALGLTSSLQDSTPV